MMTKILSILFLTITIIGFSYAALKEQGWQHNQQQQISIQERNYPNLESVKRALSLLKESQYAAIVYPERTILHGNNWFSRNIIKPEHWEATTVAKVLYTIRGNKHSSVEYGSLSSNLPNHAVFVGLCINNETGALYTPDNGFEIPATEELIRYLKDAGTTLPKYNSTSCP